MFAHIYHAHFPQLLHLSAEGHFNSLFAHFLAFGKQYDLLVHKSFPLIRMNDSALNIPHRARPQDLRDVKGRPNEAVGVGELWEKWKEMGVLDS